MYYDPFIIVPMIKGHITSISGRSIAIGNCIRYKVLIM